MLVLSDDYGSAFIADGRVVVDDYGNEVSVGDGLTDDLLDVGPEEAVA